MTSNYIIHIGNKIINKRIKIKEFLNKYERKVLEKNVNVFFYILINLLFNLSIDRFRLVINRKYIFFKNRKRIDIVFNITKKLLTLNNIDIKEKITNLIENKKNCIDNSEINENELYEDINTKRNNFSNTSLVDNIYKEYRKLNIKNEKDYLNNKSETLLNNQEKFFDKKLFYENYTFENKSNYINYYENFKSDHLDNKVLFSSNLLNYKDVKNKINDFKIKSNEEYHKNKNILEQKVSNNKYDKKSIILIKKEKKTNINIFDEFLDIYLLFRLKGGKGGFGANLRVKKRKKKKKNNFDAARNLKGNRILVDRIIETSEILLKKKEQEQILIDKLNSSFIINETDENDHLLKNHIIKDEINENSSKSENFIKDNQKLDMRHIIANGIKEEKKQKKNLKKKIDKNVNNQIKNVKSIENMYNFL
ncbi:conserved Plasmodium protein, unknown function [Plasmodium gallinaceum]|uniref:SDE2-like domain-containing protein n=1 Tax=Plasmodium gallinaceum TaxID=5849 RepID=A0A1J1GRE1_PLAGA|nr:conserved Plasmodium protein, unknown function [Plasmodium gallinaceum]CRG93610.1 conserved Plasmodium protein, unknown function [Plasmodium gallinaceum]